MMSRALRTISFTILLLAISPCLAQGRNPQSLTCPEQLADLNKQYNRECSAKFGRPPACERCPSDSASCTTKCNECKIIYAELKKKEDKCGR